MKKLLFTSLFLVSLTGFATPIGQLMEGETSCYVISVSPNSAYVNPSKTTAIGAAGSKKKPWEVQDHSKVYFITGIPASVHKNLVDGSHFYAALEPDGTHKFQATDGSMKTIRQFRFVKLTRPSDHKQP